ncbi:hypothetical protein HMPREF1143_0280 [Peptoanaerobacter stomatis]|uniref:PRTase-CE domain-containing protein n=1 Tax=Peptoanaerobacter stomatis TaxID=796937 RepID=J5UCJ4_9FIRM|nr:hypothetical protein [Peptoanaerobacter stomatis]EJU21504.1 hypothetical protein HMPREF1143_0280 [Peptoanaerobacter stomatis]NWO24675.1 hypothetical protein [Peptostreptococcaceae bacterium oral taxon 081]
MDLQAIKEICKNKWAAGFEIDARTKAALDKFDIWLSQIPDEYKELSLILIQNLEYYPQKLTNKVLIELHNKLKELPNISDDNTIYAYIKSKDGKTNSSDEYWTMYKLFNNLNREICYENINAINDCQWGYVENIVFIDDFSGTGQSFIKELQKSEDRYCGKNIYFVIICIMEDANQKIEDYSQKKNINISPIYYCMQKKTFTRDLFKDNMNAKNLLLMLTEYLKIPKQESPLGFNESESLVAFHNNTPNNTLPVIRYDTKEYASLFPRRHDKKPPWQKMRLEKKDRKIANYNNKSI